MAGNQKHLSERREYRAGSLEEESLPFHPMDLFKKWITEAQGENLREYNAAVLATCRDNIPNARVVLLKTIGREEIIFYTDYRSAKAGEIEKNSRVSLVLFWAELERQIRIQGRCRKASMEISDTYFHERPWESRIATLASHQSQSMKSRRELEDRFEALKRKWHGEQTIPRPPYWGGYVVAPETIEFWQGRPHRLNDRLLYKRTGDGWETKRLSP